MWATVVARRVEDLFPVVAEDFGDWLSFLQSGRSRSAFVDSRKAVSESESWKIWVGGKSGELLWNQLSGSGQFLRNVEICGPSYWNGNSLLIHYRKLKRID
jgi:hypothetical protein